MVYWKSLF